MKMIKKDKPKFKFLNTMMKREGYEQKGNDYPKKNLIPKIKALTIIVSGILVLTLGCYLIGDFCISNGTVIPNEGDMRMIHFLKWILGISFLVITGLSCFVGILLFSVLQNFYENLVSRFER